MRPARLRMAPSLAGYLPLPSARIALLTHRWAKHLGGTVHLRLDDLDERDAEHADAAEYDLRWLGLDWQTTERQSERRARYAEMAGILERTGRLYPCFESEDELRVKRELRTRRHQSTIYDRAMLRLTPEQRAAAEARGKVPYWRFMLSPEDVVWNDAVLGRVQYKLSAMSDPVLIRADGTPLPLFAALVDDLDAGITHTIVSDEMRGASAMGLDIAQALGADVTARRLAHVVPPPETAERITLRRLRTDGIEPEAIAMCLAWQSAEHFDFADADRVADFDMASLREANRARLATMEYAEVVARLPTGATEAFWLAIRAHLDLLTEARGWWDVVAGTIVPPVLEGEEAFLRTALELLPAEPWNGGVWLDWTARLAEATGRSADALTEPLRLALTAEDHGPDPAALLPLIGRARAVVRLQMAA